MLMEVLVHGSPKRYGTRGDARRTDPTTINQQNNPHQQTTQIHKAMDGVMHINQKVQNETATMRKNFFLLLFKQSECRS
jgi:hypothetical protein